MEGTTYCGRRLLGDRLALEIIPVQARRVSEEIDCNGPCLVWVRLVSLAFVYLS